MATLSAHRLAVHDHYRPLLPATSLAVDSGEVLVAYGDPGHGHTALALALAGRLVPDEGVVELDGDYDPKRLQAEVALVDVPGVSEPDDAVPATTIVGEELAMARRRAGHRHVTAWLDGEGLGHVAGLRMELLSAADRVRMLARLAALREPSFLVLTLPERHGDLPASWLEPLSQLAAEGFGLLVTTSVGTAVHLQERKVAFGATDEEESA